MAKYRKRSLVNVEPFVKKTKADDSIEDAVDLQTTIKENQFSLLSDDCLLDILTRVDHDDLDEVATLSQRFCNLSNSSRKRARSVYCDKLTIHLRYSGDYKFVICYNRVYYMANPPGLFKRITKKKFESELVCRYEPQQMSNGIIDRVSNGLGRFNYENVDLHSIIVDERFLDLLELVTAFPIENFSMRVCGLENSLRSEAVKERFLVYLLRAKPYNLSLDFKRYTPLITENFLKEFSMMTPLSDVLIRYNDEFNQPKILTPGPDFEEALSNFKNIDIHFLHIDVAWLLQSLFTRLRRKASGEWRFLTTREIVQADIVNLLGNDLVVKYEFPNYHEIIIKGTKNFVRVSTGLNWGGGLYLSAVFGILPGRI